MKTIPIGDTMYARAPTCTSVGGLWTPKPNRPEQPPSPPMVNTRPQHSMQQSYTSPGRNRPSTQQPLDHLLELQVPSKRQISERLHLKTDKHPRLSHAMASRCLHTHADGDCQCDRASQTFSACWFRILLLKCTLSSHRKSAKERGIFLGSHVP